MNVPNVFTPNQDGNNDKFSLTSDAFLQSFNIKVFNRWGAVVFESNESGFAWDGISQRGDECDTGTYFYIINYLSSCSGAQQETTKGFVSLAR
jgi:gliding motility-associated-like protein